MSSIPVNLYFLTLNLSISVVLCPQSLFFNIQRKWLKPLIPYTLASSFLSPKILE